MSEKTEYTNAEALADLKAVYDWLREPDWTDEFGTREVIAWMNGRPSGKLIRAITQLERATFSEDSTNG